MRHLAASALALLLTFAASGRELRDTVTTRQNDRIILTYNATNDGARLTLDMSQPPRIIPSDALKRACKGELSKLKVVGFDRIGDFGKVKWKGMSPTAFMVPAEFRYEPTQEGFFIPGESRPLEFAGTADATTSLRIPLYVAVYEKKQTYRIVASCVSPWTIAASRLGGGKREPGRTGGAPSVQHIEVQSHEEEADNDDILSALASIELIKQLLARETEVPFSQTLQMEIFNLRSLKSKIKDPDVTGRINEVMLMCTDKEQELKAAGQSAELAAKAEQQALLEQQKQEQAEAEQEAREQQEKQQKRTIWMIIGGAILAVLCFIGNGIFRHFREVRNQKNIMQMQESLARQAQHEAGRRVNEVVRNKAHQAANKGRDKVRKAVRDSGERKTGRKDKDNDNNGPRSI